MDTLRSYQEVRGKTLTIALDFDNTYTAEPVGFQRFIDTMVKLGHTVYVVTSRSPDLELEVFPNNIKSVVYCSWKAKEQVCKEQGIKIDIWIDDDPRYIVNGFIDG